MKSAQISQLLHISRTTVSRILHGATNYSKYKIERVLFYKDFEENVVESIFREKYFKEICEITIEKTTKKDAGNFVSLIQFASQCLRWHQIISQNRKYENVDRLALASLNREPLDLLMNEGFLQMLEIAIIKSRDSNIKKRAAALHDISKNLIKTKK